VNDKAQNGSSAELARGSWGVRLFGHDENMSDGANDHPRLYELNLGEVDLFCQERKSYSSELLAKSVVGKV
jgi:hypothetical protein